MRATRKILLMGILAAALLLALGACGRKEGAASGRDDSLQRVLDRGKLVLGLDVGFPPPMGFLDETGETVGFDIDVAREVCRRLGVELVTLGIDWDEKENDLNSGVINTTSENSTGLYGYIDGVYMHQKFSSTII